MDPESPWGTLSPLVKRGTEGSWLNEAFGHRRHGERSGVTGEEAHRDWNKGGHHGDWEEGQGKGELAVDLEGGPQRPENPERQNEDPKDPLRQAQRACGNEGVAPRNRNSPHGDAGMGGQ